MTDKRSSIPEPAVSRRALVLGAGVFWLLGGFVLVVRAGSMMDLGTARSMWPTGIAILLGVAKGHFIFKKVVAANLRRINRLSPHKEKICLFAFQSLESYLLVIVMVTAGILLRLTGLADLILVLVYLAVGTALILASRHYFRAARRR